MRISAAALTAALAVSMGSSILAAHAATMEQPFAQPLSTGSCAITKTEYAASASFDENTSTSFVNLGDAGSITFRQKKAGCVAGTFFANAGNQATNDAVVLQVLLDGVPCDPLTNTYFFANFGTDFSSHSAIFFCGAHIAAGTHKIQVQYRSDLGGNAEFFQRSLTVDHE